MSNKRHAKHAKSKRHSVAPQQRIAPVVELFDRGKFPIKHDAIPFPDTASNFVTIDQYTITNEPLPDWPKKIQNQVEAMHEQMRDDPAAAIPQLERLIQKYPHVPQFYNFIAVAYENLGESKLSTFWICEGYRCHPDYLFARVNLIHHHLLHGHLGEAEKIFDGKFDLKQLYPQRDVFHLTEAVCFFGAVGKYFWLKGDQQRAKLCYGLLKKLGPKNCHARWLQRRVQPVAYLFTSLFSWHTVKVILQLPIYIILTIIALLLWFLEMVWLNTLGRWVRKSTGQKH